MWHHAAKYRPPKLPLKRGLNNNNNYFKTIPMYTLPYEWNECGGLLFYTNPVTFKITLLETLFNRLYNESLFVE
jgi:hypothetical protein